MSMHNSVGKRPLCELEAWSVPLLEVDKGREKNRREFIEIAASQSPAKTYSLVETKAINYGLGYQLARRIAQSARWLAIILRDYGQVEFDRVTEGKR